jgi:hypothetical protein
MNIRAQLQVKLKFVMVKRSPEKNKYQKRDRESVLQGNNGIVVEIIMFLLNPLLAEKQNKSR